MVVRTTDGWQRVHSTLDEDSSLPSTVRSALRMRINELSEPAQLLVPAAAAIGRIVDLDLLAAVVSELDENKLLDAVDELLKKRVFIESNSASRVAFAHDLLRETVQADLSAGRRRALHRQIARVLEEQQAESGKQVQPAILARHFLAGEMTLQAFSYFLDAAENANRVYAYDDAMEYLEQAEANQPDELAKPAQFRFLMLLADAAWHTQQLTRATEAAQQALQIADSPLDQATVHRKLGTFQCMQGDDRGAAVHFDGALATLGIHRSKWLPLQLASINFGMVAFHLIPRPILRVINRTRGREHLQGLACETMYEFGHGIVTYDVVAYTDLCVRNVRYSKALDSDEAKALAYAKYAVNLGFSGLNARFGLPSFRKKSLSIRYCEMGVEHAHRDSRPELRACCETSLGLTLYCAGELSRAVAVLWNAEKTLRRCGGLHASYCYHFLRHTYSVVGDVAKVLETAERERDVSASFSYTEPVGWAYYGLTHGYALAGRIDEALAAADESIRLLSANESTFCAIAYMEKGFALVQASRYAEAVPYFLNAYDLMKKHWCFFEIMMPTFPRLVEALLGANWHRGRDAADCDWRTAKKYARYARFFSLSFPNIRPHTWRSLGRLNYALGKPATARKCFELAIAAAEKIGARYDRARALIDSAVVSPELVERNAEGWDELNSLGATLPKAEFEYAVLPPVSNSGARA